jgi:glycosyltransferase involved in cell wall biosynthesis
MTVAATRAFPRVARKPETLTVSVIIPAFNAASTLGECLGAVLQSSMPASEVIVHDDGSTDGTAAIASSFPVQMLSGKVTTGGAATGRNAAAAIAKSEILVFVDSDVVVHRSAIEQLVMEMVNDPTVDAAFGSYDDQPRTRHVTALYANLRHHYMHQNGPRRAATFWAGLGAIRKTTFDRIGGFDPDPWVAKFEDVELGTRLHAAGVEVRCVPSAHGTHCKNWRLLQLWRSDIFHRAIPWSRLLLVKRARGVLNVSPKERIRAGIACGTLIASGIGYFGELIWLGPLGLLIYALSVIDFLRLMYRAGRLKGLLGGLVLHFCYHIYSSVIFAGVAVWAQVNSCRPVIRGVWPRRSV